MENTFTWMPIYQELANELVNWESRQPELIAFLDELREKGLPITSTQDTNRDGERFLLQEIDPFTFIGVFNRQIKNENRFSILVEMKRFFELSNPLPDDFEGLPTLNNMKSWLFPYQRDRDPGHIPHLWKTFKLALSGDPVKNREFIEAFDRALAYRIVNINLTMGLFWIRPEMFLSLDSVNRTYFNEKIPGSGLSARYYMDFLNRMRAQGKPFPELSREAWRSSQREDIVQPAPGAVPGRENGDVGYWLVGAYWESSDPPDQTQRFLDEGVWENGYEDRYLDEVRSMQVNDRIAIKATTTQRRNLPFDANDRTVSRMDIKATGTIVANREDGRTIEVEWDPEFTGKSWYFFTNIKTIWQLNSDPDYRFREFADRLIDFTWFGGEQDFDWFVNQYNLWEHSEVAVEDVHEPYSVEDVIASGVFLHKDELDEILDRLQSKKTMIFQGSPGVGKTFIARKIAYALMEEKAPERLEMVQFHQSYSYDDFVRGYRPDSGKPGTFVLQDGIFYDFCKKAEEDPDRKYVFVIDEINRGNLSLIFGELLMLIEADKRGAEFSVPLVYRHPGEPRFFIPPNVYLIGLMNVADRSLAMVDYALRRRFAFVDLRPQYDGDLFRNWLLNRSMPKALVDLIIERMSVLNQIIRQDSFLGENYQVGHSYFCPKGDDFSQLTESWYQGIIRTEIAPLLKEYWFDNLSRADDAIKGLLK